jgi:hypothetical protein
VLREVLYDRGTNKSFQDKVPKIIWRGAAYLNPVRTVSHQVPPASTYMIQPLYMPAYLWCRFQMHQDIGMHLPLQWRNPGFISFCRVIRYYHFNYACHACAANVNQHCAPKLHHRAHQQANRSHAANDDILLVAWGMSMRLTDDSKHTLPCLDPAQDLLSVLQSKTYADVAETDIPKLRARDPEYLKVWKDTEELCDYQYQVYTEGYAWSGRLPHLLVCNSVVFSHTLRWRTFLTPLLVDGETIVMAGDQFEHLNSKFESLASNPTQAGVIANHTSDTFFRLLHPQGIACYYHELIRQYAKLLKFKVSPPDQSYVSVDTAVINALRGHGVRDTLIQW